MVEITDEDSARAWLETQPKQVCVAMAARAALRGVPILGVAGQMLPDVVALGALRGLLISAASGSMAPPASKALENAAAAASLANSQFRTELDSTRSEIAQSVAALTASDAVAAAAAHSLKDVHHFASLALSTCLSAAISSTETARAGADSAAAALFAFKRDAEGIAADGSRDLLFRYRVWREVEEPEGLAKARTALLQFLDADPAKWDFWARWYRGMFEGRPMDWALQRAVALIPDDVWQAGPEAVAQRIAQIEAEFSPMPPEAARAQAQVLLLRPQITVLQANGLRELIDRAVDEYRREVCNELPDCLQPLERLPGILSHIAVTAGGDAPLSEKEAALMRLLPLMAATISDLNRRLQAAQAAKATGEPDKRRLFHDAFYRRLGERSAELITSRTLWGGGLLLGVSVFLGLSVTDLQAGLSDCYENIIQPEAGPERWLPLPPQFENPLDEA